MTWIIHILYTTARGEMVQCGKPRTACPGNVLTTLQSLTVKVEWNFCYSFFFFIYIYISFLLRKNTLAIPRATAEIAACQRRGLVMGGHVGTKGELQEEEDGKLTVTGCVWENQQALLFFCLTFNTWIRTTHPRLAKFPTLFINIASQKLFQPNRRRRCQRAANAPQRAPILCTSTVWIWPWHKVPVVQSTKGIACILQ